MLTLIKLVIPKFWIKRGLNSYLLLPFSFVYRFFISLRRLYYQYLSTSKLPVPVIVVGNITVGGAGKTPLVIYLAEVLKAKGFSPGIVTRGYGRKTKRGSIIVNDESKVEEVGDEALLLWRRTKCPIVVDVDRVAAAKKLIEAYNCDVVISDDGLQHYKLPRDIEIAVVDGEFEFGNGFCLPAGPLREPVNRLKQVDFVVRDMVLKPTAIRNVHNPERTKTADDFKGKVIHAVAGIGRPQKFFQTLRQMDLTIIEHPFPDHYLFRPVDLPFEDEIVIMTEKDAVKCDTIAGSNFWYVEVSARLREEFVQGLLDRLQTVAKL